MNQNDEMEAIITKIVTDVCAENNCTFDLKFKKGAGSVVNTPSCSALVSKVAKEMYGEDKVNGDGLPIYGAEDFADFLKFVPGAFFFRVTRNLPKGVNIHHHQYDFDDGIIDDLSKLWFKIVLERLNSDQ
jgi:metal-dependent amidase/aminoacylase/carboxypeptidase family protein